MLDVRFHVLKGDAVVTSKERAFREVFRILEASGTRYALIGGLAVQLWGEEARTTLDIDVAVSRSFEGGRVRVASAIELVRSKLRAAGDQARRPSKRMRDLADAQALIEREPDLERQLSEAEKALLRRSL